MAKFRLIEKTDELYNFFSEDPFLHLYEIGDLDEFFKPHTQWFGFPAQGTLESLFLLYDPGGLPVLLALEERRKSSSEILLNEMLPHLPKKFYAHVSPHLSKPLGAACGRVEPHGRHLKMALEKLMDIPRTPADLKIRRLGTEDLVKLQEFYRAAYPGNWFDSRMLSTGQFVGGFERDELVGVAGIHVYSEKFKVAALGSIAVALNQRSRGLGKAVTHHLCQAMNGIQKIGLNVDQENSAAIACYESLGFRVHAQYDEFMVYL